MIEEYQSGSDEESHGCDITPEMETVFTKHFHLDREEAVALKRNYILHMSATSMGSETRLGLGLASYDACVYSLGASLRCTNSLPPENSPIVNVRFAPDNESLLYVGYSQGTIKLWDLRDTKQCAQQFKDTTDPKSKNLHEKVFSSFDVNCEGRFLCAGTEVTDGDAFLLFWDTRQASLLGGYWECHTDVVTQVKFHPSEKDHLLSGSTDGCLINFYDVSQTEEDEALLQSLNTQSSVDKVQWHEGTNTTVSCVTHTSDVQLWHLDDSSPFNTFSRTEYSLNTPDENEDVEDSSYVADVHSTSELDKLFVLAGSNLGKGRCLRSAMVSSGKLSPLSYFDGNKQIVRCSWFDPQAEILVTGGEAGILSLWKCGKEDTLANPSQLKATSKLKEKPHKTKVKPY
ncbi:LOW QUALITY PROTEIN: WD repeat-containing protein 89 [Homalodisca vitripennis]|uniref:LOW QUALITY PROTEIN: WD repeat-containing protein 89 n=1 Tax=Homalodisca vitripennis TaxID=197043 RepID=UPI001EECDDD3|nr:LOW QUALITY PROTEIN: WD repeat-containing protein 89 [Homalodisca vitripennis]